MVPLELEDEFMPRHMASGHGKWDTVGGTTLDSPMTIPPMPSFDASVNLMMSGQPCTKLRHHVGAETYSCKK